MSRAAFLVVMIVSACGGDGGSMTADAPIELDAPPRACASNPAYVTMGTATNRYRMTGSGLRWAQARVVRVTHRARLAFVDDLDELITLAGPDINPGYFMGVSDSAVEGEWRLITGDPATYLPWLPGEPNGDRAENFGELDGNGINDIGDTALRAGICECEL